MGTDGWRRRLLLKDGNAVKPRYSRLITGHIATDPSNRENGERDLGGRVLSQGQGLHTGAPVADPG